MPMAPSNVRFRGNSGHGADRAERPLMTQMYGPAVRSKKILTSWW